MYEAKKFDSLMGTVGFSDTLLTNHFTLYAGYVTNTNKLSELLKTAKVGTPEYAELKRRYGWEWNGMRLHELYFGNMANGGVPLSTESHLYGKISEQFGSYEAWVLDFKSTGVMRGIGWVVLYQDIETGKLINSWINEHDLGHLSGAVPLLVMDVFEHSYITDYGIKRADYIENFFKAIDWQVVESRSK